MCFLNSSSLSNHPLQSFQTLTVSPFTKANNKQTFSVWWGAGIFLGIWATTKKANKWEAGQYYSPLAKVQAFIKRCPLNASAPSGEGSIEAQQLWRKLSTSSQPCLTPPGIQEPPRQDIADILFWVFSWSLSCRACPASWIVTSLTKVQLCHLNIVLIVV